MRAVNLGEPRDLEEVRRAFREIESASREQDAIGIADGFTVSNVSTTTTLNPTTCTLAQLAQFVATYFDQMQKRGPNRVE